MKQNTIILLLLFALTAIAAKAQTYPLVRVHAYMQPALSGTKPTIIVEEGGSQSTTASTGKMNYYLYAEGRAGYKFTITGIWVDGKTYGVKTETVMKTPVVMNADAAGNTTENTVLVPSSKHKVVQFYPAAQLTINKKPTAWLSSLIETSELVIQYKWKGKTWYYAVKKIKRLEPVAGS